MLFYGLLRLLRFLFGPFDDRSIALVRARSRLFDDAESCDREPPADETDGRHGY
jgi:hypothetical protein